jgi:gamma-glutamylcyclotransferase (GGCT)/AIG2-like uncharacterized protein YtfP
MDLVGRLLCRLSLVQGFLMSDYLFVYGTLQAGFAPPEIAHVVEALKPVAKATVPGILYDLGEYPGAILDPSSKQTVSGMVLQLPDDARVLALIDKYEGFNPNSPEASQFVRVLENVALESGRQLECWTYVYNRDPESAPILQDGRFPTRRN